MTPLVARAASGGLTVAHFSDVHALSLAGVSPLSFLNKRLAGGVNLLTKRRNRHPVKIFAALVDDLNRVAPDHVVVTGDLTNLSLEPEFVLARAQLDRIVGAPSVVTLIPGNHDVYVWSARLARRFERHFAEYLRSDALGDEERAGDGFGFGHPAEYPVVHVRGALGLVGVSTARPSPVPFADGRVGRRQLAAIEAALVRLGAEGKFRIVLIHHPPGENRHVFLRGLRDRDALQAVLARAGAELVVHGHEHRAVRSLLPGPDGPIPVVGVGSATYDDARLERRAGYNLYRIDPVTRRFSVEHRVHDPVTDRFVATPAADAPSGLALHSS